MALESIRPFLRPPLQIIDNRVKEQNMLKKSYSKTGQVCRVTFNLPGDIGAESVLLCGEFTDWDADAKPMKRLKNGDFSLTLSLPASRSYRFRYLLDGNRWENDWQADGYVSNCYGCEDSVVVV
jgi:1,4-alpha-glucan branching enzyme